MHVRIGFILELVAKEPAMLLGKLPGLCKHPRALLRGRCQHNPGAKEPHELAAFDAEILRHRHDKRIPLLGAHHCQADACISAGCLDDRLSGFQGAVAFGSFDHSESQPVLDRTKRVERLQLHVEVNVRRRKVIDLNRRSIADRLQNA